MLFRLFAVLVAASWHAFAHADESPTMPTGSRLAYLDDYCDPYHVSQSFPRLITPQWVGEKSVDAVIILAIDDMRNPEIYEGYLRPILERIKRIDGRAALSIMTCNVDPVHPQLAKWLAEGLSLEVHTVDHPCPMLAKGNLGAAKSTYDRCIDLMAKIPGNQPVAFRTPCCDSLNTPSPRLFAEIMSKPTPEGRYLSIDSSVFVTLTPSDPALPRDAVLDAGKERFAKYFPFPSFANLIANYPYPYVLGRLCWEFPCITPSDWQAQHLHAPNNPITVRDMKAALDGVVAKQGVFDLVFHPHGWISAEQIVELVDYADRAYGNRVKFLSFREAHERLTKNLLAGEPLRDASGRDNGVRLLDLDNDGLLDVVIGNDRVRKTRLAGPRWTVGWFEDDFPCSIVSPAPDFEAVDNGVRFGIVGSPETLIVLQLNESNRGAWRWAGEKWESDTSLLVGLEAMGQRVLAAKSGIDLGVRLRDIDDDGCDELLVGGPAANAVFQWTRPSGPWKPLPSGLPEGTSIVDSAGRDAGLRLVDLNADGKVDIVFSNDERFSVDLFESKETGWSGRARSGLPGEPDAIPAIVRRGTNNGSFFHSKSMWVVNEDTDVLPGLVRRLSFDELVKDP